MLSNGVQWCQMAPNGVKWGPMVAQLWCQRVSNGVQRRQIVSCHMVSNGVQQCQIVPCGIKWYAYSTQASQASIDRVEDNRPLMARLADSRSDQQAQLPGRESPYLSISLVPSSRKINIFSDLFAIRIECNIGCADEAMAKPHRASSASHQWSVIFYPIYARLAGLCRVCVPFDTTWHYLTRPLDSI